MVHPQEVPPALPRARECHAVGRCVLYRCAFAHECPLLVLVVYGWTGGECSLEARRMTDLLFSAAFEELDAHA
eukprot:6439010-Alexandrium_andersonii.AAC.1